MLNKKFGYLDAETFGKIYGFNKPIIRYKSATSFKTTKYCDTAIEIVKVENDKVYVKKVKGMEVDENHDTYILPEFFKDPYWIPLEYIFENTNSSFKDLIGKKD